MENNLMVFEEKNLAIFKQLADFKKMQKEMEQKEKQLKSEIEKSMIEHNVVSFQNEYITISRVEESVSTSIDLKAFEKKEPDCYAGLLKDYPKVTKKSAYVRFTINE